MTKAEIIALFDGLSAHWDDAAPADDLLVQTILDAAGIKKGKRVLDVGCGTGNLITSILNRDCTDVTGVDFSPEMILLAQEKFQGDPRVNIMCADIMETHFSKKFDCIIVHDTVPYFDDIEAMVKHLSHQLNLFGYLCISQSVSRQEWNKKNPEYPLLPEIDLASIMSDMFLVKNAISDSEKYFVSGVKK